MTTYEGNATLMVEGDILTDGRIVEPGALTWPELPIPVRIEFHGDPIGTVDRIWREGNVVRAHWMADRPLEGLAAAIGTKITGEAMGEFRGPNFRISAGEIIEVVPTAEPACLDARFEA